MSEILWSVPEHLAVPNYWDNHSLQDDCPVTGKPVENFQDLLARFHNNSRFMDLFFDATYDAATDFAEKKSSVVLSEFGSGTTFDGRQFGVGTIIRQTSETFSSIGQNNPHYYPLSLLGVVCEVKVNNEPLTAIAYYSEGKDGRLFGMSLGAPVVEVGGVNHDGTSNYYYGSQDDIRRVTKIEILHAGVGQSKPAQEKSSRVASLQLGTNPV